MCEHCAGNLTCVICNLHNKLARHPVSPDTGLKLKLREVWVTRSNSTADRWQNWNFDPLFFLLSQVFALFFQPIFNFCWLSFVIPPDLFLWLPICHLAVILQSSPIHSGKTASISRFSGSSGRLLTPLLRSPLESEPDFLLRLVSSRSVF